MSNKQKCFVVSMLGRSNVGKSTILNNLIGEKISIVTPKIQTTRTVINGIVTKNNLQVVFLDTPGIFVPKKQLESSMVKTAWRSINEGVDYVFHVLDIKKGFGDEDREILETLKKKNIPSIVIINKSDLAKEQNIVELQSKVDNLEFYKKVIIISALNNSNLEQTLDFLNNQESKTPWLYPEDEITTLPEKVLSSEITREVLFKFLEHELPYNLTVETESWEESKNDIKIMQVIYVTRESHKKIIIGNKGSLIKKTGERSRLDLSEIFCKKVHLFLFVKVRSNWMSDPHIYNYLNMEKP